MVIEDIYKKIYDKFNFKYNIIICKRDDNNFIEKEFIKAKLSFVEKDKDLFLLKNNIRNYLITVLEGTCDDKERTFLKKQVEYIDTLIAKYDKIMDILNPQIEKIKNINIKKARIKKSMQLRFLINHLSLLTDEEKMIVVNRILENNDFNVEEFINNSKRLSKYILASCNINKLFSGGIDGIPNDEFYEEVKKYQLLYNRQCEQFKYILPDMQIVEKYIINDEIINRKNGDAKNVLKEIKTDKHLGIKILNFIDLNMEKNNYIGGQVTLSLGNIYKNILLHYVSIKQIDNVVINLDNNKIILYLLYTFFHEMGHVCSISEDEKISGFKIDGKDTNLNELFNEYIIVKIINKLIQKGVITIDENVINKNNSLHTSNYFLIEPFVEKYEEYFKEATMENNIGILGDC